DAGRTLAPAGLARDAEPQGFRHLLGAQRVFPQLTGDGEAQRIGAPPCDIALVAGDAIARAHDAACEYAAGPGVVAHFDRALKTSAGAGIGGPVEMRASVLGAIGRGIAEEAAIVEFGRAHDLAGIIKSFGIEALLDLFEGAHEPGAEHLFVEFRTHD